jgi:hypothetical protein
MCDALGVSPLGFYAWRSRPESARKIANRELLNDIRRVHADHRGRYGAPRVHAELRAEGQSVSRKRVARVMRRHGIWAHAPRRSRVRMTESRYSLPVAANLLDRNFAAEKPDRVWLAGITCIPTGEGWLYLAVILEPVHPEGGWLGDARSHARRTHDRRFDHGHPVSPPGVGPDPSFGSRQPVCRRRLPQDPAGRPHHAIPSSRNQ